MNSRQQFDVAIVGGGPCGASAALLLAHRGISIILFERSNYESLRVGETVPPQICQTLKRLGLWQTFLQDKHLPLSGISSVWGSGNRAETDFIWSCYTCGWVLDRSRFDMRLARAAESAGATLRTSTNVTSCRRNTSGWWTIDAESAGLISTISSRYLVLATGRNRLVRGIPTKRLKADNLIGAVKYLRPSVKTRIENQRTLVEAAEHGWWYSTYLPNENLVVVFMTDASDFAGTLRQREHLWRRRLAAVAYTRSRASTFAESSPIHLACANTTCLETAAGLDWIAAGDAAVSVDPLSGQGVLRALSSGIATAEMIAAGSHRLRAGISQHIRKTRAEFVNACRLMTAYYDLEQRWPMVPFWVRRHRKQDYQNSHDKPFVRGELDAVATNVGVR